MKRIQNKTPGFKIVSSPKMLGLPTVSFVSPGAALHERRRTFPGMLRPELFLALSKTDETKQMGKIT